MRSSRAAAKARENRGQSPILMGVNMRAGGKEASGRGARGEEKSNLEDEDEE